MQNLILGASLLAIGLLPLAFGGVIPLAWSLYGATVGALLGMLALRNLLRPGQGLGRGQGFCLAALATGFLLLTGWFALQASTGTPQPLHHPVWGLMQGYFQEAGRGAEAGPGAISVAPERSWEALARWLAYGATFLLLAGLGRRREAAWILVKGFALIGLSYAAYGLVVQLGGFETVLWFDKWAYRGVLTASFINRNSYATYGGLVALCWTAWLLQALPTVPRGLPRRERVLRYAQHLAGPLALLWVALLLVLTSVLLTQSRAGITAGLLGLLVLMGAYLLAKGGSWRRLALLLPVLLVIGVVGSLSADGVLKRLDRQGTEDGMRAAGAAIMSQGIADSPWLGFGRGAFEPAFDLYRDTTLRGRFDRGHQDYLETGFEIGLPAALLLFGLLGLLAGSYVVGLRNRHRDLQLPALGLGALALVAFHAAFDFSLQMPAVAALYLAIAATSWAQSFSSRARA